MSTYDLTPELRANLDRVLAPAKEKTQTPARGKKEG